MKIFYRGQGGWNSNNPAGLASEPDLLALSGNNWDDYGTKTTFNAALYFGGKRFEFEFHMKILIAGSDYTAETLNTLKAGGWDGFFPIPNNDYISVPSDIDFYQTIISKLGMAQAIEVVVALRDAGFLINTHNDQAAIRLSEDSAFSSSLLRESGANKAYQDGWNILSGGGRGEVRNFSLNLVTRENVVRTVPFKFESSLLPYDINIIIGPNGIGKSHCLKSLVEYWLQTGMGDYEVLSELGHQPFDSRPNISKLVLVSYSPFEDFNLDLKDTNLIDKETYRYFGFRKLRESGTVGISKDLPALNSSHSLINAIYEDEKFEFVQSKVSKLKAVETVLKPALEYDCCVLEIELTTEVGFLSQYIIELDGKHYLPMSSIIPSLTTQDALKTACKLSEGVLFIKDSKLLKLSSGQRLFTYIVINVVGEIRDNSLVVIDEPELFLHPTLEIEFVSLLKEVLKSFKSKAILATHSLAVVREVPSNCVHIFRDEGFGLDIIPPPFETFGASVQRISSYVFGDKSVSKPFDACIDELLEKEPDAEKLIELLGNEVNEELMMKILRLGRVVSGS